MSQAHSFPKTARLLRSPQFRYVGRKGSRVVGSTIIIDWVPKPRGRTRLGITVTKKYGRAWERNRFKRKVREAFRKIQSTLPTVDLVIRPRTYSKKVCSSVIQQEIETLLATVQPVEATL